MHRLSKAVVKCVELILIAIIIGFITLSDSRVINLIKQLFTCAILLHNIGVRKNKLVHAPVKHLIHHGGAVGANFGKQARFFLRSAKILGLFNVVQRLCFCFARVIFHEVLIKIVFIGDSSAQLAIWPGNVCYLIIG